MSPEQFDREQAGAFLRFLDPEASRFTFQIYDDGPAKRPEMAAWFHGSLDALWGELCRLSRAGAGIFVTINETDFKGRKAGNIIRIRALFADLDGAPLANAWNVALRLGWISKTSPGRFHAYWRVTGIELDEFKPLPSLRQVANHVRGAQSPWHVPLSLHAQDEREIELQARQHR
jgi:putative DNA primase/helicase